MKMFSKLIVFFLFVLVLPAQERSQKYWIYFTSKEPVSISASATADGISSVTGISPRALQRRKKMSATAVLPEDLPVSTSHLAQLRSLGIVIENTSRWLNAATAYLSDEERLRLSALPFVRSIEPVKAFFRPAPVVAESTAPLRSFSKQASDKYSYGFSATQMNLINAMAVHNIGISGRGVLVGMLDTGFRWKMHDAMKHLNVISEYDFIQKDSNTANEEGDSGSQDSHGTSCMSLVGGYAEGTLISPAFNADFILGKTEYVPTETNVEEDNWVAAIEWMEAQGVDIISSSLGYKEFDAGQKSYDYADMNGKIATTSVAAATAARKGVVVVSAMGNEGVNGNPPSITSPADADSIISVGAVSSSGTVASFSSNGPTSDGRTKPDVVSQGISVYAAVTSGAFTGSFGGTSAATPLTAGVAAMILSARPELTPVQVRDALRTTAGNAAAPNNTIGWGIINAYEAVLHHGMVIGTDPEIAVLQDSNFSVGIFVVSKSIIEKDSVTIFYTLNDGASFIPVPMTLTEIIDSSTHSGKYTAAIPGSGAAPKFYVRAVDASAVSRTSPYAAPAELYDAVGATSGVALGSDIPQSFALLQNFPNPFNPATTVTYDVPRSGMVTLTVYDVLGRKVQTLVNEVQTPRRYSVHFDGTGFSSGVYIYRLQAGDAVTSKRMMLVK